MNFHRNHWLLLGTIFFGFIFLGLIIAIGPAYWVQAEIQAQPNHETLSPLQQKGLKVYISEGCVACHTQQVRPIAMDKMWGRPSTRRDYTDLGGATDVWRPYTPAVLGSERTGPDLSDVGSRQSSKTWQYMHLYNPRSVVSKSIMPAFPWLFDVVSQPGDNATVVPVPKQYAPDNGKVVPNARGKALVAYLLSLHQEAKSKSQSGQQKSAQTAAKTSAGTNQSQAQQAKPNANGATLYSKHCAGCHQANGQGLPGAFPPLAGDPVVTANDPTKHIDTVLNGAHGRTIKGKTYGSSMPAFGSHLSNDKIAAIINHERTSWGNKAPTITAAAVAKQRKNEAKSQNEAKSKSQSGQQKPAQTAAKTSAGTSQSQAQQAKPNANGATLYSKHCASCHQANGQGLPGAFPPLAGDPVVTAHDPTEHIDTVLNGAHGRTIKGKTYGSSMPAFGSHLSNDKIAAIINHERTSWGNKAPTITAAAVAKQRDGGS